jgi:hypothetical protein
MKKATADRDDEFPGYTACPRCLKRDEETVTVDHWWGHTIGYCKDCKYFWIIESVKDAERTDNSRSK